MDNLTTKYKDIHAYLEFEERRIQEEILDLRNTYNMSKISIFNVGPFSERWRRIRMAQADLKENKEDFLRQMREGQIEEM